MTSHILFFRQGAFSHINERVAGWLREQFPACDLIEVDILQDIIKPSRYVVGRAGATALLTYLPRILQGDRDLRNIFYRTPYLFRAIRRRIAEKYSVFKPTTLFTFQTQSLYDASMEGIPHFLYTDHTHLANLRYPGANRRQLFSPAWIQMERNLYHRTAANFVMSDFVRNSLIEDYSCDPAKVEIVGAAPNMPPPATPPDNDGYTNHTILCVGVDWQRKGGPILIEAFRRVLAKFPDARLLIAGASPAINAPNIEIHGRIPPAEVSRLLLRSSVVAFPSLREPQGIFPIEALMHGIPVIASNIAAIPEVVHDGKFGRLIPPRNADALATALLDLLSNPALCRQYGEAGRQHVDAHYSSGLVSRRMGAAIRASLALPTREPATASSHGMVPELS